MVARTIVLPNIRRMFVPDPGCMIAEADLAGADAQVVAWEADDADLKEAFRSGVKIHAHNAKALWGEERVGADGKREPWYTATKRAVHATNYGASARTVAVSNKWSVAAAERFQADWARLHPNIFNVWHRNVDRALKTNGTIYNRFGYRVVFFGRPEDEFTKALAWTPQSTVAILTRTGMRRLKTIPWVQLLIQVHDSIVFQYPLREPDALKTIREALHIVVPYDDPLVIPWTIKTSAVSWGDCK